ncbi:hypothetical protein C6P45_001853 [Maudiozyma exigua]|uniref:LicD/FKTN/FKRP nucleotidyltransferase domain-containing protein n=1 Tax=Maudiozyma exigua TaxID=34358 RepID=A0A9P7B5L3_MAUEX|nr:hypothetical protein C6P45_001853 [Kazachstania exigua]
MRATQKNFRRNILITSAVYTVISIIFIYRVALYGEDDSFNSFIKPLFLIIPTSLMSNNNRINIYPSNAIEAAELYEKLRYNTSGKWIDEYYLKSNLLTLKYGSNRGKVLSSIDEIEYYDSDPRLVWSVYLTDILNHHKSTKERYTMPFSWYDFADFQMYNKLISIKEKYPDSLQCSILLHPAFDKSLLQRWEKEIGESLFLSERFKYEDPFWYRSSKSFSNVAINNEDQYCKPIPLNETTRFNIPLNLTQYMDRVRPEAFDLQARNYLLNNIRQPLSITLLNKDINAYRIDIKQDNRSNLVESGLLKKYIRGQHRDEVTQDIKFDHDVIYSNFLQNDISENFRIDIPGLSNETYNQDSVTLTLDDFKFDTVGKINDLLKQGRENLTGHDRNYLESLEVSSATHAALAPKYFKEPGGIIQFRSMGHHRDERFFHGALIYDEVEYSAKLNSMIRTFQKFVKANGLISWLSHGTLYGHLYNGMTFPWDNDFDLQMPLKHLHYMSQYFNQSIIMEDPREGNGRFLLDVGTSITVRVHGNGNNNIDARFIDIDSGLYIDITALAVTSDVIPVRKFNYYDMDDAKKVKESDEIQNVSEEAEKQYYDIYTGLASLSIQKLRDYAGEHQREFSMDNADHIMKMYNDEVRALPTADTISSNLSEVQRYLFNQKLTMVNCRNYHFNTLEMITPLRASIFHGVPVLIPHKPISSLKIEYKVPSKYGYNNHEKHTFTTKINNWVPISVMSIARNTIKDNALFNVHSNLVSLKFNDLLSIFKNLLIAREYDTFTVIHNAFETVTYRQKEIEIEYDKNMEVEEKKKHLRTLREHFSGDMESPAKDPLLLQYERDLWNKYTNDADAFESDELVSLVNEKVLKARWKSYSKLYEQMYFKINDQYLDNVGMDLFEDSQKIGKDVFTDDPRWE